MTEHDLERLLTQCRATDPTLQVQAIQELMGLGEPATGLQIFIEMLESPDVIVRCSAAEALGRLGRRDPEQAGTALMPVLNDPEAIVRSEAVDAIGVLRYARAAERLKVVVLKDPDALVRASAAETLGDLGDRSAVAALELALRDEDDAVRGYAANSIGLLGTPGLIPKLRTVLQMEKVLSVKAELHGALYRLGSVADMGALLTMLSAADASLSTNILNILNDLSRRKVQTQPAMDATLMRSSMESLVERVPVLAADAEQLLARIGSET